MYFVKIVTLYFCFQAGEIKYLRMGAEESPGVRCAFVEYTTASSFAAALTCNGATLNGRIIRSVDCFNVDPAPFCFKLLHVVFVQSRSVADCHQQERDHCAPELVRQPEGNGRGHAQVEGGVIAHFGNRRFRFALRCNFTTHY